MVHIGPSAIRTDDVTKLDGFIQRCELYPVYTIQPVVSRLSNGFDKRLCRVYNLPTTGDNRLHGVNGAL